MAFMAAEMSFVASGVRSVRVSNGASRLRNSSVLFGFDLAGFRPSCELVFILQDSTSFDGNIGRSGEFAPRNAISPAQLKELIGAIRLKLDEASIEFLNRVSDWRCNNATTAVPLRSVVSTYCIFAWRTRDISAIKSMTFSATRK